MNPNDTFFDGHYKELWKSVIPEELTNKEIDFMVPYFDLKPGSKVLDLMCGYGRHALALARKGIEVTAVDNLPEYIHEIQAIAGEEVIPVRTVLTSVLGFEAGGQYDLVICMGNSLQFFERKDVITILNSAANSLKPGGHILINSWSLAEIVIRNFKENSWSQIGDKKFLVQSAYRFSPARMEIRSTIISPNGDTEEKDSVDYIYSINEMESMMKAASLNLEEVYSIPGKKKFTLGEPRAYLVAIKNNAL
jgi:SAM-dependent methyltransferase